MDFIIIIIIKLPGIIEASPSQANYFNFDLLLDLYLLGIDLKDL